MSMFRSFLSLNSLLLMWEPLSLLKFYPQPSFLKQNRDTCQQYKHTIVKFCLKREAYYYSTTTTTGCSKRKRIVKNFDTTKNTF